MKVSVTADTWWAWRFEIGFLGLQGIAENTRIALFKIQLFSLSISQHTGAEVLHKE
jgi:hypothetical protein